MASRRVRKLKKFKLHKAASSNDSIRPSNGVFVNKFFATAVSTNSDDSDNKAKDKQPNEIDNELPKNVALIQPFLERLSVKEDEQNKIDNHEIENSADVLTVHNTITQSYSNGVVGEMKQNSHSLNTKPRIVSCVPQIPKSPGNVRQINSKANCYNGMTYAENAIQRRELMQRDGSLSRRVEVADRMKGNASFVFYHGTSSSNNISGETRGVRSVDGGSTRAYTAQNGVTYDEAHGLSVYRPVPRPLPAYRMPPPAEQAPAALPGAAPSHNLGSSYPIEREVIVSCVNKNTKIPLLNDRRPTGKLGVAVAPDVPPKHLAAWTHATMENQHIPQPGTSNDVNYRIPNHEQVFASYLQNPASLNQRNYNELVNQKPPVPIKTFITYGNREQNVDNPHPITSREEPEKDSVKETPKTKSKTYTTLKDMISRFKGKDSNDNEKHNDSTEINLNNVNEITPEEVRAVQNGQKQIYGRQQQQTRMQEPQYVVPNTYQRNQMQMLQHQQMMNQQMMRSQQHIMSADSLYQTQGFSRPRSIYEGQQPIYQSQQQQHYIQVENRSKQESRSQQQMEREMMIARSFTETRRTASQPHLLEEYHTKQEQINGQDRIRRNSHGNILEIANCQDKVRQSSDEKESDDGGFRDRFKSQERASFESRRAVPKQNSRPSSRTSAKNDDRSSQTSIEAGSSKLESNYNALNVSSSRLTPSRIEDLKGKKSSGSGASSDYDKSGGNLSSNVDSGRGSVAYSSGRRPTTEHDTSADSREIEKPTTSKTNSHGDPEWVDIVESELRQILEPKFNNMKINDQSDGGRISKSSRSSSSITPPLPPLSPNASDSTPRRERRYKHHSLPLNSRPEYEHKSLRSPHGKQKHSKREHSSHYKKQLFGLDTTDLTSTTTRSLDLSSLLGGNSDSDVSAQDARAIRRQLQGLENMYCEVLKLLGVRKPVNQISEPRMSTSKRRYGSMSSLPSSSVSSRPIRDKRRVVGEHRKKTDIKSVKKRFERLESHVVTLARSVAHLSGEMRAQHTLLRELDAIRAELAALRAMHRAQYNCRRNGERIITDPKSFSNPDRVKRLTKFFGDEPPLMRQFLKKLGYEKYAALLEAEKVGAAELPYVGEERLRTLGVPLGPRLRILKEAGAHLDSIPESGTTNTTLAIV